MRKLLTCITAFLLMICFCVPVLADTVSYTANAYENGTVHIKYTDKLDEGVPIPGAEFTFYKIGEFTIQDGNKVGTTYASIIPGLSFEDEGGDFALSDDPAAVLDLVHEYYGTQTDGLYKGRTDTSGNLDQTLPVAVYLVEETNSADGYMPSVAFLVSVPMMDVESGLWDFDIEVEPKAVPLGDLTVSKKVTGTAGETDRDFHFTLTLTTGDDITLPKYTNPVSEHFYEVETREFSYTKSDGTTGTFKSGDVFTLKHDQSITVSGLPVGTGYVVTETEAGANGYATTSDNSQGNITKEGQTASFVNHKDKPSEPGKTTSKKSTGDDMYLYIGIFLILLAIGTLLFVVSKKRKK